MNKRVLILLLMIFGFSASLVYAEGTTLLQIAVWDPIQLFPAKYSVAGIRTNLFYSNNYDVYGIALGAGWTRTSGYMKGIQFGTVNWSEISLYGWQTGLLNYSGRRFVGFGLGGLNIVRGNTTGVQLGIANWDEGFVHGLQWGLLNYVGDNFVGFQNGLINKVRGNFSGYQFGLLNFVEGDMTGLQVGWLFNHARRVRGIQLGLFNIAESLEGMQIGLGNYNANCEKLPFMPLLNCAF